MALKFVNELPQDAAPKANTNKVFTDDVIEELQANKGKWALIPDATPQGAAAFIRRNDGFEYKSVDTGKESKTQRKAPRTGEMYYPTIKEIYVRFTG